MDDSVCLLIVPSGATEETTRLEMMTSEQFMSAMSSFHVISDVETISCGTQVGADAAEELGYHRDASSQTKKKKTRDRGSDAFRIMGHNVGSQTKIKTSEKSTETQALSVDAQTMMDLAQTHETGVNTDNASKIDCGVNTVTRAGIVLPFARTTGDRVLQNKPTKTQYQDKPTALNNDRQRSISMEKSSAQRNAQLKFVGVHLKNLKNIFSVITKDLSSRVVNFADEYLAHVSKITKLLLKEDMASVMEKDKKIMENFTKDSLWMLTNKKNGKKRRNTSGKIEDSDSESSRSPNSPKRNTPNKPHCDVKKERRPTGIACPTVRSTSREEYRTSAKRRRVELQSERPNAVRPNPRSKSPSRPRNSPPNRTPPMHKLPNRTPPMPKPQEKTPSMPRRSRSPVNKTPHCNRSPTSPSGMLSPSQRSRFQPSQVPPRQNPLQDEPLSDPRSRNERSRNQSREEASRDGVSMINLVEFTKRENNAVGYWNNNYRPDYPIHRQVPQSLPSYLNDYPGNTQYYRR